MTGQTMSLREEQKQLTRARIRRCARACFVRASVREISLEMIAEEAGVGRTTLYQYYPNKNELLVDLMEQSLRASARVYQKLADLAEPDVASVRAWLSDYLRDVEDHASSVTIFHDEIGSDERVRQMLRDHWQATTDLLGKRYPAFDYAGLSGSERVRRKFRAELAISEIENFCAAARFPDYHFDHDIALDVLAERLVAMLE